LSTNGRAALFVLILLVSPTTVEGEPPSTERIEREVVAGVNAERKRHGLAPLSTDAGLAKIARGHSCAMAKRAFFDHATPEGETPGDRMRKAGRRFHAAGENIARIENLDPVKTVVAGWMNSPPHRENILTRKFTRTGVGACRGEAATKGRHVAAPVYFTQVFEAAVH
jgi:uncharacterized protein YkwD